MWQNVCGQEQYGGQTQNTDFSAKPAIDAWGICHPLRDSLLGNTPSLEFPELKKWIVVKCTAQNLENGNPRGRGFSVNLLSEFGKGDIVDNGKVGVDVSLAVMEERRIEAEQFPKI